MIPAIESLPFLDMDHLPTNPHKPAIVTNWNIEDGVISQRMEGMFTDMTRMIIKTRDEGVRKALIEMGWTPPPDKCAGTHQAEPNHKAKKYNPMDGAKEIDRVGAECGHSLSEEIYMDERSAERSPILNRQLAPIIFKKCKECNMTIRAVESYEGDLMITGEGAMNFCPYRNNTLEKITKEIDDATGTPAHCLRRPAISHRDHGESRHETALRYIRRAEESATTAEVVESEKLNGVKNGWYAGSAGKALVQDGIIVATNPSIPEADKGILGKPINLSAGSFWRYMGEKSEKQKETA